MQAVTIIHIQYNIYFDVHIKKYRVSIKRQYASRHWVK